MRLCARASRQTPFSRHTPPAATGYHRLPPTGDTGITAIAAMLSTNRTLETLNLDNNDIHCGPATPVLADALVANENLKVLKLSHNRLGDQGAAILALGLQTNQTIEVLDLTFNRVIEPGRYRGERIEI